ncbi:MAG TPA: hypothetical protein VFQ89_01745 [Candidatus Binatia bacterium]|jgi:hypothetical protein|nr:hypothetical protein [Candidatus Binatia bacterium]
MIDDPKRDEARRERAERAFKRREEGAQAMTDYEAEGHAVRAKTARLKAQREERADAAERMKTVIIPIKAESGGRPPSNKKASVKAAEMAGNEIDRLGDRSATDEQRASRKRRLLKGPKEFRNIRDENVRRG